MVKTRRKTHWLMRFWTKIDKTETCWLWKATKDQYGYGMIWNNEINKLVRAHRVSFEMHFGKVPNGLCVLHHCDIRNCVRPDHLFLGTRIDNYLDKMSKGRHRGWKMPMGSIGRKLTPEKAMEIRNMYLSGGFFQKEIAKMFGIIHNHVLKIVNGRCWGMLPAVERKIGRYGKKVFRKRK